MQTENATTTGIKKVYFSTVINASKEKVWNALWDEENYKKWTSPFSEGSCAVSDWNEGSKILFLDGKGSGMYSIIHKKVSEEVNSESKLFVGYLKKTFNVDVPDEKVRVSICACAVDDVDDAFLDKELDIRGIDYGAFDRCGTRRPTDTPGLAKSLVCSL